MINFKNIEDKYLKIFLDELEIGTLEYTLAADEAQIIDIIINSAHRGKGYGSKLLGEFLSTLTKNFSYSILEVRETNLPAIKLYKKFGFSQIDMRKNYYKNPTENALIMKKLLIK